MSCSYYNNVFVFILRLLSRTYGAYLHYAFSHIQMGHIYITPSLTQSWSMFTLRLLSHTNGAYLHYGFSHKQLGHFLEILVFQNTESRPELQSYIYVSSGTRTHLPSVQAVEDCTRLILRRYYERPRHNN
jgi:hypothetical protein